MKKYKNSIYIFFISLFILSCTDSSLIGNIDDNKIGKKKIVLTPDEFTSIAYDNPKELTIGEVSRIVDNFLNNIKIGNDYITQSSNILCKNKYYISDRNNIIKSFTNTHSITSDEIAVPLYEIELYNQRGDKNLAVVCGDERIPEVIFYIENYSSNEKLDNGTQFLLELSKKNILFDIQQVEYIKHTKRDSTLCKVAHELKLDKRWISYEDIKEQVTTIDELLSRNNNPGNNSGGINRPQSDVVGYVNPLSKVSWTQNDPYNYARPIMMVYDGYKGEQEGHLAVGCANIALGILFSIIKPNMILNNGQRVDWDYTTSVESIKYIEGYPEYSSPDDLIKMISGLLAQIATDTGSYPFYEEKEIQDVNGNTHMKSVITQTETPTINTINYLKTKANFSGNEKSKFNGNLAKQSLFDRKPVFLCGAGHIVDNEGNIKGKGGGHAWLIDGVVITKNPQRAGHDHYWSVNMGWGKWSRTYFRTSNNLQDCDVVFPFADSNIAYYTQEMTMLHNITRK